MNFYNITLSYFFIISIIGFFSMGLDKHKARKHRYRTRERTLLLIAILGGSIGSYLGMQYFHHKTLHKKFTIGIPLIFFLQLFLVIRYYSYIISIFS